jgi:hypothetical protein
MTGGRASREEALSPTAVTMFTTINRWVEITGQEPPEVEPGSPLAGDARKSKSLQVAHAAWAGVVHSVDHLHALRALLIQAQVLNLGAPYTLARSAMENAATAVWLLEPAQRPERLRRRLKRAHHEAWEEGKLHELLPAKALKGKRSAQQRMAAIRALARPSNSALTPVMLPANSATKRSSRLPPKQLSRTTTSRTRTSCHRRS